MRILLAILFFVMTGGYFLSAAYVSGREPTSLAALASLMDLSQLATGNFGAMGATVSVVAALLLPGLVFVVGLMFSRIVASLGWRASLGATALAVAGIGAVWHGVGGAEIDALLRVVLG